jgi:hypothetical protein
MRTPNRPTGFSLSRICRQRSLTAPAGLYNQKLTHLRLLIDLPLLFEARPQPSITYRSLRDSYKADRDTNAQNSAGTNQFSTIGHSSYGNCLSDADRRPPRGWAMRWASSTGVVFSACALGRSGLGQTNTCQISESMSEFLEMETMRGSARNWRALGRQWNPSAFPDQAERPLARTKRGSLSNGSTPAEQSFLNGKNPMRENRETKWRLTP